MPSHALLQILFEDDDLLLINKPPALAVIPGRGETQCVLRLLAQQLNLPSAGLIDPRVRIVHRLDKDTSGALLLAKNIQTQRFLSHQFQNSAVGKEYLALVAGRPLTDNGIIEAPLAPHPTARDRMAVVKNGKPSITEWQIEQRFRNYALIRCFPKTGRTHQIRVHLQSIGLPLAVDPLYNPPSSAGLFLSSFKRDYRPNRNQPERPLLARLSLHAHKLTFNHPSRGPLTIEAPPPKDFRAAINQLSNHAR